jgi:dynein heavy chain, axonemal
MEKENHLTIIKQNDSNLAKVLKNSIQLGTPLLIENIEKEIDPILDSILFKTIIKKDNLNFIRIGQSLVEYNEDFRLYITTCLRNPNYLPQIGIKVKLVNFVITQTGLEDQLLSIVTQKERIDLETNKNQLIQQSISNRRQLKSIEDHILEILSKSDDILENETAVDVLSSSKELAREIYLKEDIALKTEKQIDIARNEYKPVERLSSFLFSAVSDLAHIDPMYQFSLNWFIQIFEKSINESEKSTSVSQRILNLKSHFTFMIHQHICRSLFLKDKLLFSFTLCISLMKSKLDKTVFFY